MEKALHSMIYKQFERWDEQGDTKEEIIEKGIFHGLEEGDGMEERYAKMLVNAMKISAEISAKVILEILLSAGVVEPTDERQLRKNFISIVKEQDLVCDINQGRKKTE